MVEKREKPKMPFFFCFFGVAVASGAGLGTTTGAGAGEGTTARPARLGMEREEVEG